MDIGFKKKNGYKKKRVYRVIKVVYTAWILIHHMKGSI